MKLDHKYRVVAGCIGALALVALIVQFWLTTLRLGSLRQAVWFLLGYFTILTNMLGAGLFLIMAATGRRLSFSWMSMLTLSMLIVALVYHTLLAHLTTLVGLRWWVDQAFHTIVPAFTLWFWLMDSTRHDPRDGQVTFWLLWPTSYAVYALARGGFTGQYAYPFIDVNALGVPVVLVNMALLVSGFAVLGLALKLLGRAMPLRD